MSNLNYYILIADWLKKIPELGDITSIDAVNVLLEGEGENPFKYADTISGMGEVYTLTGNYLFPATIKKAIEAVPWFEPMSVQLFHRGEHDARLTEIPLNIKMCVVHEPVYMCLDGNGVPIGEWEQGLRHVIKPFIGNGGDHD